MEKSKTKNSGEKNHKTHTEMKRKKQRKQFK